MSHRFLNFLTDIRCADLLNQLFYLKAEATIYRKKCVHKRIVLSDEEKNYLLKFALPLGPRIRDVITITDYSNFRKWVRQKGQPKPLKKLDRPRIITDEIRILIVDIARRSKFGYGQILSELKKLAIKGVSRTSVKNILREYDIPIYKIRTEDTWGQKLKRTFNTLYACDFFTQSVWTPFGRRLFYVLFFINIKTRQVYVSGVTRSVTKDWLLEQTHKLSEQFIDGGGKAALVRDRGIQFCQEFDDIFVKKGFTIMKIPKRSPNLNPYAESWVATIKRECLNHFVILGKCHLGYLIKEFENYYNHYRSHSSIGQAPLPKYTVQPKGSIRSKPFLGGLVNHYYRE